MAGRQRLSLPHSRGVQQLLGGGATELNAARSFLVVLVGEESRRATILDGASRARTLGGAFRSRVRDHHPETVATVFRYAVHDLRHHSHRRKQQKQSGRLAGALPGGYRRSTESRTTHPDELASEIIRFCSNTAESAKKLPPVRGKSADVTIHNRNLGKGIRHPIRSRHQSRIPGIVFPFQTLHA